MLLRVPESPPFSLVLPIVLDSFPVDYFTDVEDPTRLLGAQERDRVCRNNSEERTRPVVIPSHMYTVVFHYFLNK